jgi:methanogenic corrinoid protein MtbC1
MLNVYEELGETSRRQILAELRSGPKGVNEIVDSTKLKQPNVSNHLARMRAKGIVRANKVGRQVFYSLASPEVEAIVHSVFAGDGERAADVDFDELSKQYAKLAIQGDEQACGEILDAAFRSRASLLDIYQELLAPAMTMVGTWWKVEAIDEAQEHMASAITERMMARTAQITGPARRHGRTAILGLAPNSWHVIGLRMLADYLRMCGWRALFLGANVPVRSFLTTVDQNRPNLVLLSSGSSEDAESTVALIRALSESRSRKNPYVIGIGGHAVESDPERYIEAGADFTAPDLRTFAEEYLPQIERYGRIAERTPEAVGA